MAFTARLTGTLLLDQMFQNIETELRRLDFMVSGADVITKDVKVTDTQLHHGLRRAPKAVIQCVSTGTGVVSLGSASTTPTDYLNVKATVAGSYNLIVI